MTQQEYYDDAREEVAEIRARIAKVEAELAEEPLTDFGKKIAWSQLKHLEAMLAMALDQGD